MDDQLHAIEAAREIRAADGDGEIRGYCPVCFRRVSNVTVEATGYCETHGRVFVEWNRPDALDATGTEEEEE